MSRKLMLAILLLAVAYIVGCSQAPEKKQIEVRAQSVPTASVITSPTPVVTTSPSVTSTPSPSRAVKDKDKDDDDEKREKKH